MDQVDKPEKPSWELVDRAAPVSKTRIQQGAEETNPQLNSIELTRKHVKWSSRAEYLSHASEAAARKLSTTPAADPQARVQSTGPYIRSVQRTRKNIRKSWTIHPQDPRIRKWDLVTGALLIFTAIVTPFEVSFLVPKLNALFCINRIVDACFLADILLQFFLDVYDEDSRQWLRQPSKLAARYAKGMFALDVVSILPFDALGIVIQSETVNRLKGLRLLRLLRLSKLFRMLRLGRVMQQLETQAVMSYASLQLIRFFLQCIVIAHWMACGFHMMTVLQSIDSHSWLQTYDEGPGHGQLQNSIMSRYVASLYWAVMTMSTIGYGDVPAQNDWERAFCIVGMFFGASIFAHLVGSICGLISSMSKEQADFYQIMDDLTSFMDENSLPKELKMTIREFFFFRRRHKTMEERQKLFFMMSPALRMEVAACTHQHWIRTLTIFKNMPVELLVEMCLAMKTEIFSPHEVVFKEGDRCNKLYLLEKGVLVGKDRFYTTGAVLGGDSFYVPGVMWKHPCMSVSYCVMQTLKSATFHTILDRYPDVKKKVHWAARMYEVRTLLVMYARAVKHMEEMKAKGSANLMPWPCHIGGLYVTSKQYLQVLRLLYITEPEAMTLIHAAATYIQATWRGYKVRVRLRSLRMWMSHKTAEEDTWMIASAAQRAPFASPSLTKQEVQSILAAHRHASILSVLPPALRMSRSQAALPSPATDKGRSRDSASLDDLVGSMDNQAYSSLKHHFNAAYNSEAEEGGSLMQTNPMATDPDLNLISLELSQDVITLPLSPCAEETRKLPTIYEVPAVQQNKAEVTFRATASLKNYLKEPEGHGPNVGSTELGPNNAVNVASTEIEVKNSSCGGGLSTGSERALPVSAATSTQVPTEAGVSLLQPGIQFPAVSPGPDTTVASGTSPFPSTASGASLSQPGVQFPAVSPGPDKTAASGTSPFPSASSGASLPQPGVMEAAVDAKPGAAQGEQAVKAAAASPHRLRRPPIAQLDVSSKMLRGPDSSERSARGVPMSPSTPACISELRQLNPEVALEYKRLRVAVQSSESSIKALQDRMEHQVKQIKVDMEDFRKQVLLQLNLIVERLSITGDNHLSLEY